MPPDHQAVPAWQVSPDPRGRRALPAPGAQGATGPQGPAAITTGYQQALTGGSIAFSNPTVIGETPQLPAGTYAVLASLSVSGAESGGNAVGWTTSDSAGVNNTDSVQAEASLWQQQALSVNDIWKVTKAQDSIDLVCDGTATAAAKDATITVFPLTHADQTTIKGPTTASSSPM